MVSLPKRTVEEAMRADRFGEMIERYVVAEMRWRMGQREREVRNALQAWLWPGFRWLVGYPRLLRFILRLAKRRYEP